MKRILLTTLLVCSLNIPMVHAWEGNWLVGVSGGYGTASGTLYSTISYLNPAGLPTAVENVVKHTDFVNNGWSFGGLVGYQVIQSNWLLGAELSVDWLEDYDPQGFALYSNPSPGGLAPGIGYEATAQYDRNVSFGLTGRIGFAVTEYVIPYIRLGVEIGRESLDVLYNAPVGVNAGNLSFRGDLQTSRTNYRFLGGVGVEIPLCGLCPCNQQLRGASIRAEYNYHSPGRALDGELITFDNIAVVPLTDQRYTASYKPHIHSGKVSLVWNFG